LLGSVFQELTAARLGTIAIFSLACGVVAFHIRTTFGTVGAVIAVIALLTFPRIFSEAHFATLDAQLTAWWLMLWAADMLRPPEEGLEWVGLPAGSLRRTNITR